MSVRIDDPDSGQRPRGGGARLALVAVVGVVVAGVLAWSLVPRGSSEPAEPSRTTGTRADTGALPRGSAPADLGDATRQVSGVPRGFPQTVDGAVQAYAATLGFSTAGMATLSSTQLSTVVADVVGPGVDYTALQADKRALLGVDQQGRVIDAEEGDEVVSSCPPALGAYRTSDVQPAGGEPAAVTVSVWGPCVYGVGSPARRDRLNVAWQQTTATMVWRDGDWRIDSAARPSTGRAPTPVDVNRPDTTFDQRAQLLGEGWELFAGASEAWPTALLGQEP